MNTGKGIESSAQSEGGLSVSGILGKPVVPDEMPKGLKINISSPCYGGKYTTSFVNSMISLLNTWKDFDIDYIFSEIDTTDVEVARNILLSNFYFNKLDCTHILFIDNDMGYRSSMINRMLKLREDVVGVVSPRRQIDLKKLHASSDVPFETALARSVDFILNPSNEAVEKDGFIQVYTCGSGIMLISRDCITKMADCCPDIIDKVYHKRIPFAKDFEVFLTPFNKITVEGHKLSEDFSFCYRWVEHCHGKIFANIDSNIRHVGTQVVESKLKDLYVKQN